MEYYFLMKKYVIMSNENLLQVEDFNVLVANCCLNRFEYNQAG